NFDDDRSGHAASSRVRFVSLADMTRRANLSHGTIRVGNAAHAGVRIATSSGGTVLVDDAFYANLLETVGLAPSEAGNVAVHTVGAGALVRVADVGSLAHCRSRAG